MKAQIPKYNVSIIDGKISVVENAVSSAAKDNKKAPEFIGS